jgi:hypothetical protein
MQLLFVIDNNLNNLVTYLMDIKKVGIETLDQVYLGNERRPRRYFRLCLNTNNHDHDPIQTTGYFNFIKKPLAEYYSGVKEFISINIGDVIEIVTIDNKNRLCKIVQFEPDVKVVEISYYGVRIIKHSESDENFIKDSQRIFAEYEQKLKQLS